MKERDFKMAFSTEQNGSSSEEEDLLDETHILEELCKHYPKSNGLGNTSTHLENILHSGAATCLICIRSIRRNHAIWSCKTCFCILHLECIRIWANDSLLQQRKKLSQQEQDRGHYNHLGEFVPPKIAKEPQWCCPLCRNAYESIQIPTEYVCFCGKTSDPELQPFLVPHSCGEICGKSLNCAHTCTLLCHPGPCAPCVQYTNISCLCGKSPKILVRCTGKGWQCERKCENILACGLHVCNQKCHDPMKCQPCTGTSIQPCECGRERKERICAERKWHCQQTCGKTFACGIHKCEGICHAGDCGDCPLGLRQTCPCGKIGKVSSCTDTVEPCGNTCQKILPCGAHTCTQRCHFRDCGPCLVVVKKRCRCGQKEKEMPCSKEFTCDVKCKNLRECGKHTCNRKCCLNECPPCEKICGKQLQCNKHKCQSVCHNGPCFPCRLQSQVNCFCGKTSKSVPCGRERKSRIICLERCRHSSKCHHPVNHRCHKGSCPPCQQICGLPNDITKCGHECAAKCHSAVMKLSKNSKTSVIKDNLKFEYVKLPHPKCERKMYVKCIGGHQTAEWPCWDSKPKSCFQKCNRDLKCSNHRCDLICHEVEDPNNMNEQRGCSECKEVCKIPRSPGCVHSCGRGCHKSPCDPCEVIIKTKCHCGLNQAIYKCSEYFTSTMNVEELNKTRERLRSCGNRCLKNYFCGHRCNAICHSGECPNPESCRKKLRITCNCKRLKQDISCDRYRAGQMNINCNEQCFLINAQLVQAEATKQDELERQEELKNRIELEKFEKKFGKRKQKERKCIIEKSKQKTNWNLILTFSGLVLIIVAAVIIALYADN